MALTDPKIKQAKPKDKDCKLSDSKGLYLLVAKTGAKYWRLKYRFLNKEKVLALGVYPDVDAIAKEFGCPIQDQPWAREVKLTDPDGNRLRIGQRID